MKASSPAQTPGELRLSHSGATPLVHHSKICRQEGNRALEASRPFSMPFSDRRINLGSQRSPFGAIELDREGSDRAVVQPELAILVLFYDQVQRIYSLIPATGAIPIHQAWWEPRSMQTAQIADTETRVRQWLTSCG
jgi:hypothetical protein